MQLNIDYDAFLGPIPSVDDIANHFYGRKKEFRLLAVKLGLTFDLDVQATLPRGEWVFDSPFRKKSFGWQFHPNSAKSFDLNHPQFKSANPSQLGLKMIQNSHLCVVYLHGNPNWEWQDGPWYTTTGDEITVSGAGVASLVAWCRQIRLSTAQRRELHFLRNNPCQLKRQVMAPF